MPRNPEMGQASDIQAEYDYWVKKAQEAQASGDQAGYEQAVAKIKEIQKQAGG